MSRGVGSAVERNRISRQLRHLVRDRLVQFPRGAHVVIRPLPGAAGASSAQLGSDLDSALAAMRREALPGADVVARQPRVGSPA